MVCFCLWGARKCREELGGRNRVLNAPHQAVTLPPGRVAVGPNNSSTPSNKATPSTPTYPHKGDKLPLVARISLAEDREQAAEPVDNRSDLIFVESLRRCRAEAERSDGGVRMADVSRIQPAMRAGSPPASRAVR